MGYKPRELTSIEKEKAVELLSDGLTKKEISNILKLNYSSLRLYYESIEIPARKTVISKQDEENIVKLYVEGNTFQQLHANYYPQYSSDQLNHFVRKLGLTRRRGKQNELNHKYFENITTPEQAYWLGMLTADGCIQNVKGNSYSITLSLQEDDKYLVDEWGKAISSNLQTKIYVNDTGFQRKDGKAHTEARFTVYSKKMASDLEKLGVIPQKSQKLNRLPNLEKSLRSHYVRGYFDGNGSATHYYSKSGIITPRVIFYGTAEYLSKLELLLREELKFTERKITTQKDAQVSLFSYGNKDAEVFYDYIYKDATVYMFRKEEKISSLIRKYRDKCLA